MFGKCWTRHGNRAMANWQKLFLKIIFAVPSLCLITSCISCCIENLPTWDMISKTCRVLIHQHVAGPAHDDEACQLAQL